MNKEVLFAKTLEQVRKTAKEQGNCISEEQVKEAFAELDLSNEQLQMVFDYLLKHKIGIGQPMDPDEFLTEEEKDYLQEYLDEVAALPTYSDGEKLAFSIAAMAGETDAQQRLIEIHLADVAEIAKLYAGQGVLLEDLVGEGNLALSFGVTMLGSLEKPDEVEGMLGKMIMDAMEEYIAEHAENSKIDKRVEDKVNKVADKARELAEELHRKVTTEELMEETGITAKPVKLLAVRFSEQDWYAAFLAEYTGGMPRSDGDENDRVVWMDWEEALSRSDVPDLSKKLITAALSGGGRMRNCIIFPPIKKAGNVLSFLHTFPAT